MSNKIVLSIILIVAVFASGCGSDHVSPEIKADLSGKDYFRGAMLGYGPAAKGGLVAEDFAQTATHLNEAQREDLRNAQETMIDRIDEIDPGFFNRLKSATETGDRPQLMRLLDESGLLILLATPASNEKVVGLQDSVLLEIAKDGGFAALSSARVKMLAEAALTGFDDIAKTEVDVRPIDVVVIVYCYHSLIVPPPTCVPAVQIDLALLFPVVRGTSDETQLQREQLVDDLVRSVS